MMRKTNYLLVLSIIFALPLMLVSCGGGDGDNDGDEPDEPGNGSEVVTNGPLVVNGVDWEIANSAPNFTDELYCYWGQPKGSDDLLLMLWYCDLNGVSVGDNVTSSTLIFPLQDAEYEYVSGNVKVTRVSKSVSLKFNNVTYRYKGSPSGGAFNIPEDPFLTDELKISGSVEFIHNQESPQI